MNMTASFKNKIKCDRAPHSVWLDSRPQMGKHHQRSANCTHTTRAKEGERGRKREKESRNQMHRVADVEKSSRVAVSAYFPLIKSWKEKWNCVFCWMQAQKVYFLSHEWPCAWTIFCVGVRVCMCVCVFQNSYLHPQRSTPHTQTNDNRWTS